MYVRISKQAYLAGIILEKMQNEQRGFGEIDIKIREMNVSMLIPHFVLTLMRKGHIKLWKLQ